MNRYVRRGSKGIALLDESSGYPRLHYVFDVSDTGVRRNSRDPERWEMNDDLFKPVSEMLTAEYGISHERLSQQLVNIAEKLVNIIGTTTAATSSTSLTALSLMIMIVVERNFSSRPLRQ